MHFDNWYENQIPMRCHLHIDIEQLLFPKSPDFLLLLFIRLILIIQV